MKSTLANTGKGRLTLCLLLGLVLFIDPGCHLKNKREFKITCIVTNLSSPQKIYLKEWYDDSISLIDSGIVSQKNQEITFKGNYDEERLFTIFSPFPGNHLNIIVADTPVVIHIDDNKKDWLSSSIEGSVASNRLKNNVKMTLHYGRKRMSTKKEIDSLQRIGSSEKKIKNLKEEVALLHKRNIIWTGRN